MFKNKKVRESKAKNEQCITLNRPKIKKTIMKMANECHIKLRQKGYSQHKFHFPLDHPKAGKFMRKIAGMGVVEDFKVPCWLMRTIRKNLEHSAHSIFGGLRADKAKQLLAEAETLPQSRQHPAGSTARENDILCNLAPAKVPVSKIKARLRQCVNVFKRQWKGFVENIRKARNMTRPVFARQA